MNKQEKLYIKTDETTNESVPKRYAHRGFTLAPEGVELKPNDPENLRYIMGGGVECDVCLTKDGKLMVVHSGTDVGGIKQEELEGLTSFELQERIDENLKEDAYKVDTVEEYLVKAWRLGIDCLTELKASRPEIGKELGEKLAKQLDVARRTYKECYGEMIDGIFVRGSAEDANEVFDGNNPMRAVAYSFSPDLLFAVREYEDKAGISEKTPRALLWTSGHEGYFNYVDKPETYNKEQFLQYGIDYDPNIQQDDDDKKLTWMKAGLEYAKKEEIELFAIHYSNLIGKGDSEITELGQNIINYANKQGVSLITWVSGGDKDYENGRRYEQTWQALLNKGVSVVHETATQEDFAEIRQLQRDKAGQISVRSVIFG